MGSRDLDLIIRILKSRESDANLKKIKDDVNKLQKQLAVKVDYGKQMAKGMNQASESTEKLRKNVNTLNKSFRDFGREAGVVAKKTNLKNFNESVGKTVGLVRRLTKQVGGFARDSIDSFRKVTDSVGPVTNAMTEMATMQAKIEKHTINLDGLTSNLQTKYHSLTPTLGMVAGLFSSVSANMGITATQTLKTYEALDLLSKKIREIQVVGRLRGVLNLDQDIRSLKLFRTEIEKLRMDLASIRGERVAGREFGVTDRMVEDLRKARAEVDLLRERYVKLGQNVRELEKLNAKFREQAGLVNKTVKALGSYIRNADRIKELPSKIQNTVTAYARVRDEIIKIITQMGRLNTLQGQTRAVYPEQFRKSWEILRREFKEGSSEIEVLLKKIESLHRKATQQIVDNNLKIAQSSRKSIDAQRDDFADLESLTSRQRVSIDKLVQKYRELKVGLDYLGTGFRTSAGAQKVATEVLRESDLLLSTLAPKYRRLVQEINAWTQAQYKNMSSGEAVSAILKQLSGDVERLSNKEKVLTSTSKILGNEQNLLEKRLAVARNMAKLYSDAIIRLNEALLRLNPAVAKDVIQIAKINAAMQKLVIQSGAAAKSVNLLSSSLTRVSLRGGDAVRAMHRVSAVGFGSMIVSQAAWMAGFQVVFGMLDKFSKALISVVDLQRAVVRAMRTTRSELMSTSEIYKAFTNVMIESRMRTGSAIEDLGEIMYQLGSAGLSAEESMAALNSTLANIIGTEADVRNITKLIAGIYNNFADSIVKVNGAMTSLSATSKEWTESLIESATLTEKFTYINDLLVAAFRDNQVEMMEMRDGLKFMIQSSKMANLELSEMVGILAFLNNHMIKSGQAGRAMRVILSKLTKDAAGFAEAFKIEIDLQKPLDFLEIMRKLNERFKGEAATVEELGKVFKKLGLRGAEAFNLIMRNVDTLEGTISNLQNTLTGAASEMERIRLSDLASQAGIAATKIEGFLRTAMIPLSQVLGIIIGSFNLAAEVMMLFNKAVGGTIGTIVKFVSTMALVAGSYVLIKNLANIFKWFGSVLVTVIDHVLRLGKAETSVAAATQNLGKKLFTLGTIARMALGAGIFFAIGGLIQLIKYFGEASLRAKKYAEEQRKIYDQQITYINQLEMLLPLLRNQEEINEKNRSAIQELIMQTGIKIRQGENDKEIIIKVHEATAKLIGRMKELAEVQREIALGAELKVLKKDMEDIAFWGKAGLTVWQKFLREMKTGKLFEMIPGSILPPRDSVERIKNFGFAISNSNAKIEEFNKALNRTNKLAKESEGTKLEEQFLRMGDEIARLRDIEIERVQQLIKVRNEQEKVSNSTENLTEKVKRIRIATSKMVAMDKNSVKIKERLITYTRMYSDELGSLRKAFRSLEILSKVFKELGTSGTISIGSIIEQFREMEREESIKNFSDQIEFLSDRIKAMPKKNNEIKKLMKDATKLGIDGSKMIKNFYKEIDILKNKQLELAKVSLQLRMDNLALQYSGLGISANEAERAISGLISATGNLQNKVDSSKNSILQARSELNKLNSTYRLATSGTEEYKKVQEDIMSQRRIISILTERLTRHEMKMFSEVRDGIQTFKEMQDRIEKYIVVEENARIELIKMRGALRLAESGSEGYEQALAGVTVAQRDLTAASSDRIRVEYEEIINTLKLRSAYSGIERSIRDQIDLLGSWQKTYRDQQTMYRNEINQLGSSADALRDKNKLYGDLETSIKNQIQKLDEQYTKEEKLIEIAEKTGRLTASQAALERVSKMTWHEAERLKLQKEFKAVSESHQAVLKALGSEYDNSIKTLEEGIRRVREAFDSLEKELKIIAQVIGDKIVGDKEVTLNMDRKELDKVIKDIEKLVGTAYTIVIKGKYIPPAGLPKYRGGLTMASGGMVPARVTSGEGYIPPSTAVGHLDALNTLNGGRATSSIPSSIAKFHGPGGIDNIPALLPKGSYVLSTKGMAAYERSVTQGATGFQEGGEVNEEIISSEGEATSEIGRFTIVVQKEGVSREYPIYGLPSVLNELKEELETERLTKLH